MNIRQEIENLRKELDPLKSAGHTHITSNHQEIDISSCDEGCKRDPWLNFGFPCDDPDCGNKKCEQGRVWYRKNLEKVRLNGSDIRRAGQEIPYEDYVEEYKRYGVIDTLSN